jgi:hypothetical protein
MGMATADTVFRVATECAVHCVSPDDGHKLFARLRDALRAGRSVQLDFAGVETISTVFLNVAIGKLFGEFDPKQVEHLLRWENAEDADDRLIKLVIRNAKAHYQMNPSAREREAEMVRRALGTA